MERERQLPIKKKIIQAELGQWEKKESEKDEKKVSLKKETKESISKSLKKGADYAEDKFATRWFKEHPERVKAEGFDPNSKSPEYMHNVTWHLGGFKELETNPKYKEENKKIAEIYFLRRELHRGPISIETLKQMGNLFEKRIPWVEEQLNKAIKEKNEPAAQGYRNRLKEFSSAIEIIKELTKEK